MRGRRTTTARASALAVIAATTALCAATPAQAGLFGLLPSKKHADAVKTQAAAPQPAPQSLPSASPNALPTPAPAAAPLPVPTVAPTIAPPTIAVPRPMATFAVPTPTSTQGSIPAPQNRAERTVPHVRAPAPAVAPPPSAERTPAISSAPLSAPAPTPTSPIPTVLTPASPAPAVSAPVAIRPAPPATDASRAFSWWWALVPAGLAGLGALVWRRRRTRTPDHSPEMEPEAFVDEPVLEAALPPEIPATPLATPPAPSFGPAEAVLEGTPPRSIAPEPMAPAATSSLDIGFEPLGLRLSLVYATLRYRLVLRATGDRPAGQLFGDMISAHGSLSQEEQLAPPIEALAALTAVPAMRAGEQRERTGELVLPLAAVLPLRKGDASYLVPLVRLVLAGDGAAPLRRVFTLGLPGEGQGLAPLRLDTPRNFEPLGVREVEQARTMAVPVSPTPVDRAVAG